MRQLAEKQAIDFYESGQWKDMDNEEIVKLQLFQTRLCVPFGIFHKACGEVFDRDVYSHEFANTTKLKEEYLGQRPDPSLEEIFEPIKDKLIFIEL